MLTCAYYQHASRERDQAIANEISRSVTKARKPKGKRARKQGASNPEGAREGHAE